MLTKSSKSGKIKGLISFDGLDLLYTFLVAGFVFITPIVEIRLLLKGSFRPGLVFIMFLVYVIFLFFLKLQRSRLGILKYFILILLVLFNLFEAKGVLYISDGWMLLELFLAFVGVFLAWLSAYVPKWAKSIDYEKKKTQRFGLSILLVLGIFGALLAISVINETPIFFGLAAILGVWAAEVNKFFMKLNSFESSKRPEKLSILDVNINNMTMNEAVKAISNKIEDKKDYSEELSLIVTPYSEYFIKARNNKAFREVLNGAELSLPDGIFVLWAASFNAMPVSKNLIIRFFQLVVRFIFSGAAIVLYKNFTRRVVKERVSGSQLIYPLMQKAAKNGHTVFMLGGRDWGKGNAGMLASKKLQKKYPGLKVVGVYPGNRKIETREEALQEINKVKPDILIVCFGGGAGETWMFENKHKLQAKVGIGLGGTFDFIAGYAGKVHPLIGSLGLEWFFRPLSKERDGLLSNLRRAYRVWHGMILSSIIVLIERLNYEQGNR